MKIKIKFEQAFPVQNQYGFQPIDEEIEVALVTTLKNLFPSVDHLCCGLCGKLEFLISASRSLNRPELFQVALRALGILLDKTNGQQDFNLFHHLPRGVFNPGFMQGLAGIGYTLLRLMDTELVGLSHMAISKYEKGSLTPSSDILLKLAKALEVSVEFFFRPETIELGEIKFRKRLRLRKKVEESIKAQIADQIERRLELENLYPNPPIQSLLNKM